MVIIEKNFERGGTVKQKHDGDSKKIIFGAVQKKKPSKTHVKQKPEDELNVNETLEVVSAELLNHKTIQEGMVVMGYIENVDVTELKIVLPGRIITTVPASSISEAYNRILSQIVSNNTAVKNDYKPLNELFVIGERVYGKVLKINTVSNDKINIELSLMPKDIHSEMNHKHIKNGMIFTGAISEVQEHGYVIEMGIKNLRCFLPLTKICHSGKYNVGQLICVKIDKLTKDSTASTAICKEITSNNKKIKDSIDARIEYILPTTIVRFTITKILKDGLQGSIMNGNFTAYCNEHHLGENPLTLPGDFELNSTHNARVLYVVPITKMVCVSLNFINNPEDEDDKSIVFKKGDIIENAIFNRIVAGGIVFVIDNKYKALMSFKSMRTSIKLNYDQDELLSKYVKNPKRKIRIISYDPVEDLYLCSDNSLDVDEKYYSLSDLEIGEIVNGVVEAKRKKVIGGDIEGYYIRIGKVKGYMEKLYTSPYHNLTENSKVRCRVVSKNSSKNIVYVTNRSEYLMKDIKILKKISKTIKNHSYLGTVVKINKKFVLVKFFNDIKGILYKNTITTPTTFYEGQTMNFQVASFNNEQIVLRLVEDSHRIGEFCVGKICHIIEDGLDVTLRKIEPLKNEIVSEEDDKTDSTDYRGLVPLRLLSEFPELVTLRLKTFHIGDEIEVICVDKNYFSYRDIEYFKNNPIKSWKELRCGDVIRAFVKNVTTDGIIELFLPVNGFANRLIKVHMDMFFSMTDTSNDAAKINLTPEQIVYVKILSKNKVNNTKTVTLSAKLTDTWSGNLQETADFFVKYLQELQTIKASIKPKNRIMHKLQIGDICNGKVLEYNESTKDCLIKIKTTETDYDNTVTGIIKHSIIVSSENHKNHSRPQPGSNIKCIVLWIDYANNHVYLTHNTESLEQRITKGCNMQENINHKIGLNAKILLKTDRVIVCSLKKGKNPLILVPMQLHYNDFESSVGFGVKEGDFCRLAIIHESYAVGMFENIWKNWNNIQIERKRKLSENEKESKSLLSGTFVRLHPVKKIKNDVSEPKEQVNTEKTSKQQVKKSDIKKKTKKRTSSLTESDSNENKNETQQERRQKRLKISDASQKIDSNEEEKPENKSKASEKIQKLDINNSVLPGASDFWSNDLQSINVKDESSSSDDEETKIQNETKKKKKLTSAERFQAQREEEARLREIEEKYANPNMEPETVDQFERLVLSAPNDSKTWIRYMVYHCQAAEIDKARIIARKALKTISFREEDELINIWVALLNLELNFGTKETFDEIFKESLLYNDPFKIHTRVIRILCDAKNIPALRDVVIKYTKKFKERPETWKSAATAYYDVGLNKEAEQFLHKAVNVVPARERIETIRMFASLYNKYGNKEMAHALFEELLQNRPDRVDIWSQYIDMLVKDENIESARRTFEKAIVQVIPLKKMRVLFNKYLTFEQKYGTEETVSNVKLAAENYAKKAVKSIDPDQM